MTETWLKKLKDGDEEAYGRLYKECYEKTLRLAVKKLTGMGISRAAYDQDDLANSMFRSFWNMLQNRAIDIADQDELWRLLNTILGRKVIKEYHRQKAQKRDQKAQVGESYFARPDEEGFSMDIHAGKEPTPQMILDCQDMLDFLLSQPDAAELIPLKSEGFSNTEIAEKLNCSTRTVQRNIEKYYNALEKWQQSFFENATELLQDRFPTDATH